MSKGRVLNRFPAVAVSHSINPGDDNKAPAVEVEMRGLENQEGRQFWIYCSLHENAQEITAKTLRTLGWKCDDITALEGLGSTVVNVVEKEDEYKGKIKSRFDVWPRTARPTLREDDRQSFAARFKKLAAKAPVCEVTEENAAPATLPPVAAQQPSSTPSTDGPSSSELYA